MAIKFLFICLFFSVSLIYRAGGLEDTLPTIPENGLSNRIRSLFEVATATEEGAQCPLLWRMYLKFTVNRHLEALAAVDVFQIDVVELMLSSLDYV